MAHEGVLIHLSLKPFHEINAGLFIRLPFDPRKRAFQFNEEDMTISLGVDELTELVDTYQCVKLESSMTFVNNPGKWENAITASLGKARDVPEDELVLSCFEYERFFPLSFVREK